MNTPIVDHWWTKIVETDARGKAAAQAKLDEVTALARTISQAEGVDVANNILANGLIETALLRCVQFHDRVGNLTADDLHINYRYATAAMEEAQGVIDNELAHLNL